MVILTSLRDTSLHKGKVFSVARTHSNRPPRFAGGFFAPGSANLRNLSKGVYDRRRFVELYEIELRLRRHQAECLIGALLSPEVETTLVCVCSTGARARRECHLCVLAEWIRRLRPDLDVWMDSETVPQERWWANY